MEGYWSENQEQKPKIRIMGESNNKKINFAMYKN